MYITWHFIISGNQSQNYFSNFGQRGEGLDLLSEMFAVCAHIDEMSPSFFFSKTEEVRGDLHKMKDIPPLRAVTGSIEPQQKYPLYSC